MPGRILCATLLLIAFILLAGCSSTVPPEDLTRSPWLLVSYLDKEKGLSAVPPGSQVTLSFREDGKLSGNAGCNDYFGTYRVDGGLLSTGGLVSTEKYCLYPQGVMDLEGKYLSLLPESTRYNIDGDELTLSYYDERKLLVFKRG
ncbi:MAG: META domain-containing protein [Methanoregulaceae archaeon]|nr:META domain-containing protein [Methanoregulaceae archaeon]